MMLNMEYIKAAIDKVKNLGNLLGAKTKETTSNAVEMASGADGQLSVAKKALGGRKAKLEQAEKDALGMANGGRVRPQRG